MATVEIPHAPFRISMLIYDTRYRSLTIQAIALIGFMAIAAWLVNNTIQNLSALGKDFDFGFLWSRAGYDINQHLISYSNDSTHGRAAVVGILNTFLVAALGCVTATIIGVFVGVLRLSPNWLVARLAGAYVEIFRNVPVLLWILALLAILTEVAPAPSAFRGDDPAASMILGSIAVTNRGVYAPWPVFEPGWQWVLGTFIASLVAIVLFGRYATKRQEETGERLPTFWIKLAIFFVPTLLVDRILGGAVGLEFPTLERFNFQGGLLVDKSLIALWMALSLYTGAFIAENVRAGIQAVSHGQTEAAQSLGLKRGTMLRLVIIPQALRVIIPPTISQYLNLTKNSSLAVAVAYEELVSLWSGIALNQTGQALVIIGMTIAVYETLSLLTSAILNWYNKRIQLVER
jgi:general L-amino acid transport system permease protein